MKPENVVLELCKSRTALLYRPDDPDTPQTHHNQQQKQQGQQQLDEQEERRNSHSHSSSSSNDASSSSSSSSSSSPGVGLGFFRRRAGGVTNPMALSGPGGFLPTMARTMRLGGQSGMLLRLLIAEQSKKAADQLGVQVSREGTVTGCLHECMTWAMNTNRGWSSSRSGRLWGQPGITVVVVWTS